MVNENEDEDVGEELPTEVGQLIDGDVGLGRRAGEEGDGVEGEDREGVEEEKGRVWLGEGKGNREEEEGWEVNGGKPESISLRKGGGNGGVGRRPDLLDE